MRGGPRLLNSAYVTGALCVMLLISGMSYWSTSSQNKFLAAKVEELQEDLKLEAKLIEDTEARCAKYQLHITEERDKYQLERNDCQKKFDLLEKENIYQVGQIDSLEEAKAKLLNNIEELKIDTHETRLQEENIRLSETVDDLQKKLSDLQTKLEEEQLTSRDLKGKLDEILETNPHIVQPAGGRKQQQQLGEGQLADVNPAAVSVVKKDTLAHNGIQILPAANNGPNFGAIPPPNTGGGFANPKNNVSPLPQPGIDGLAPNIKRGISSTSTSPIPKRAPAIVFDEPILEGENENKNENISIVDENGEGAIQDISGIADEENVEKILDAQIENMNNSKEARALDQIKDKSKEEKPLEEFQGIKKVDEKLEFLDHDNDDTAIIDEKKNDVIDEENVQKIMEAQVQSKELQGPQKLSASA